MRNALAYIFYSTQSSPEQLLNSRPNRRFSQLPCWRGENGWHNDADPFIVAEPFHSAGRRKSGISTFHDLNGTEPWFLSLKLLLPIWLLKKKEKKNCRRGVEEGGLLAGLSRQFGISFLAFFLFLLCWAAALCVVLFLYLFLPTIHVTRQQVSLFVSGKNWSRRESLLSDIAPTRCTFHADNGTALMVARLQPDQCTYGGPEIWWVWVHYTGYVLDLGIQQLADGQTVQCQHWPFLPTSTYQSTLGRSSPYILNNA